MTESVELYTAEELVNAFLSAYSIGKNTSWSDIYNNYLPKVPLGRFELFNGISDKLRCLAGQYFSEFKDESNKSTGYFEKHPDWARECRGNCVFMSYCAQVVKYLEAVPALEKLTESANQREKIRVDEEQRKEKEYEEGLRQVR